MNKKLLFNVLILSFLTLGFAKAQNIEFEDPNLKAWLLSASPDNEIIARDVNGNAVAIDTNGDGEISYEEALNIYELGTPGMGYITSFPSGITSLKGIEYFTNLTFLNCGALTSLESIDVSKNINLQTLVLRGSSIETIDLSKNINLQTLYLDDVGIKTIDVSKNINLQTLWLNDVDIKTIDLSKNINLQGLGLSYDGNLQSLDLSKNINLQSLNLEWSSIGTIDVSKNINLQYLNLSTTLIETLDVSKNINLQYLDLRNLLSGDKDMKIKTLDVSHNIKLTDLALSGCSVTSLYMKNGVKKNFDFTMIGSGYGFYGGYNFHNTKLNYICCDEDEVDTVKNYMQSISVNDVTVTSDCEPYGLGMEDLSPSAKVTLYPNPVKEVLYFSASGKVAKAEIYDLNGRLVKTATVSNNSVNVSSLSKGVYLIILHTDKGTVKEKFIKN